MSPSRWPRIFRLDAGPDKVERALDEELEFHLTMRIRRHVESGMDPDQARRIALESFGDVTAIRAECLAIDHQHQRKVSRMRYVTNIRQDALYAVRSLSQRKGFTAVMLLILALGIGANTATFSVLDALMLRRLPVANAGELVSIGDPRRTNSVSQGAPRTDLASYPEFLDLRASARSFSGMYATGRAGRLDVLVKSTGHASTSDEPEHPRGRYVSAGFFDVLGVRPLLGRAFGTAEDGNPGASPVAVISNGWWERRFGSDRGIIGKGITVNGVPLTIVGVTPRGFTGDIVGQSTDLWLPLTMQPALSPHSPWLTDRSTCWLLIMGRRKPGVTLDRAKAEVKPLIQRILLDNATTSVRASVESSLRDEPVAVAEGAMGFSYHRSVYAAPLFTLAAAVGLVLLIVCANVANLMLARASARGREISVRMALGAGRRRLLQQLLTESLIVAAVGAALGLLFARWGRSILLGMAGSSTNALPLEAPLNARVLVFTALLALVTAVLFGLVPALRATRVQLAESLRAQGRASSGAVGTPGRRFTLGKLLVVAQVALSVLVLVGTGMLVRSTQHLLTADVGMARDELLMAQLALGRSGYAGPKQMAVMREIIRRVEQLPGVTSATMSENGLFSGTESGTTLNPEGFTASHEADTISAYDDVLPAYFRTIGAHILLGRDFGEQDNESGARVAVINRTMADFYYPSGGAIGRHVRVDSTSWEIVGIVADVVDHNLRGAPDRRIYFPMFQMPELPQQVNLEVRTKGDPAALVGPVRQVLHAIDPSLAVLDAEALSVQVRDSVRQDEMLARIVSFFGILALVLASLGLYGVMAYATDRRVAEFGLRAALGAKPGAVAGMVVRESAAVVLAGLAIGIPLSVFAMRYLKDQLFGIGVFDWPSVAIAVLVLGGSALLAGYLPARRASRVAPLIALRAD